MPRPHRRRDETLFQLDQELKAHARRASGMIRLQRVMEALPGILVAAMPMFLVAGVVFLVFRLLLLVSAPVDLSISPLLTTFCLLTPAFLYVVAQVCVAAAQPVDHGRALAHVDQQLGLEDRLQTAAEFLEEKNPSPFMAAAIQDAARVSPEALKQHLKVDPHVDVPHSRAWLYPLAAALLVVLGLLLPVRGERPGPIRMQPSPLGEVARAEGPAPSANSQKKKAGPMAQLLRPSRTVDETRATRGSQGADLASEGKTKEGSGRTRAGRSATVGAPSGTAQSKGSPSNQGKAAQSKMKPRKKGKPRAPGAAAPQKKNAARTPDNKPSGSTMGRGSGRGASNNPVASEWSSRDQAPQDDEEAEENDEEVEDENEKSPARGGVQPNLRDRRPPPSRDLGMGFGNKAGGDGRGGPSQRKKSRGTASLVLGVPIPDHIKGQMNPGTTKVTQERIDPEKEESQSIAALQRTPESHRASPLVRPHARGRMSRMIDSYFRARRAALTRTKKP